MPKQTSSCESTGASRANFCKRGDTIGQHQKMFTASSELKFHNTNQEFPCPMCSRHFRSGQALGGHQNAHRYRRRLHRRAVFPQPEPPFIQPRLWPMKLPPSFAPMAAAAPPRFAAAPPPPPPCMIPPARCHALVTAVRSGPISRPIELLRFGLRNPAGPYQGKGPLVYNTNRNHYHLAFTWAENAASGPYVDGPCSSERTDSEPQGGKNGEKDGNAADVDNHHKQMASDVCVEKVKCKGQPHDDGVLDLELRLGVGTA